LTCSDSTMHEGIPDTEADGSSYLEFFRGGGGNASGTHVVGVEFLSPQGCPLLATRRQLARDEHTRV